MSNYEAMIFASAWQEAWNSHNLSEILPLYLDDFELYSPPRTCLKGKKAIRRHWATLLEDYPNLHFNVIHAMKGVGTVMLIYEGIWGLSADTFHIGESGRVAKVYEHDKLPI